MTPLVLLAVPLAVWGWHVWRAARGRAYPVATWVAAILSALVLAVALWALSSTFVPIDPTAGAVADSAGPWGVTREESEYWATVLASLGLAAAFLPLELVAAGIWWWARARRRARDTTTRSLETV